MYYDKFDSETWSHYYKFTTEVMEDFFSSTVKGTFELLIRHPLFKPKLAAAFMRDDENIEHISRDIANNLIALIEGGNPDDIKRDIIKHVIDDNRDRLESMFNACLDEYQNGERERAEYAEEMRLINRAFDKERLAGLRA